ncbi:MAG: carboxypeptidase-like regulatory domain-containing protein, partial [Ginsengibacter sp.]
MRVYSSFQRISLNTLKVFSFLVFFCFSSLIILAQQKVTGIVLTNESLPLPGATVVLKGSTIATAALNDGSFIINAKSGDLLEISYTGFIKQEIKIGAQTSLRIILEVAVVSL